MFNLENQITTWRNELSRAGIADDSLAELESHLRDDITQQLRSGAEAQPAFTAAAQRLGCPVALQNEFKKVGAWTHLAARAKNGMLSFAGIPNHFVSMNAPSTNLDSRWTTYLRSALFVFPAICLWVLASIYVVPQFHALWDKANSNSNTADFNQYLRFDLSIMSLFKDNLLFIAFFALVALGLLEWRVRPWARYRRAVFSVAVFLVNLAIVFSFAIVFLGATIAAQQFATQAK